MYDKVGELPRALARGGESPPLPPGFSPPPDGVKTPNNGVGGRPDPRAKARGNSSKVKNIYLLSLKRPVKPLSHYLFTIQQCLCKNGLSDLHRFDTIMKW